MSWDEQWYMSEAMMVYGGSFVQALGEALRRADEVNSEKLITAFPEYCEAYAEFARTIKHKAEAPAKVTSAL